MTGAQPSRLLKTDSKRGRLRSSRIRRKVHSRKIFIDDFSLLFYYHLNTGKEVIQSI